MGNCWATCIKRGTKKKDTRSPYKIATYFLDMISEFVIGWFLLFLLCFCVTFYVGIPADPTGTVIATNLKNTVVLTSFGLATVGVMGVKGSFGLVLKNVFGNPWFTILAFIISLMDARIRTKDLWLIVLPLVYCGFSIAGSFAGVASYSAAVPSTAVPDLTLVPSLANTASKNLGWVYFVQAVAYLLLCHVFTFTLNGSRRQITNLWPMTLTFFVVSVVTFSTTRLFPNFIFNVGYSYLTGNYELLWVDVVAALTGIILTSALYFFVWAIVAQPDQALRWDSLNIPFDFSVPQNEPVAFVKMSSKHMNIQYPKPGKEEQKTM